MNALIKALLQHLVIFTLLVIGMVLIVFISSQFNTPHPDAYRDGVMSIVYVYIIILPVHGGLILLKKTTRLDAFKLPQKLFLWHQNSGVIVHIAILFTAITVINNIMMVTGIDTPKQGTFAYTHLLMRTLIVTLAVFIWMFKDVIKAFKVFFKWLKSDAKTSHLKNRLSVFFNTYGIVTKSAVVFTIITVFGCMTMVILSLFINPQGGVNLYISLLILYLVIVSVFVFVRRDPNTKEHD